MSRLSVGLSRVAFAGLLSFGLAYPSLAMAGEQANFLVAPEECCATVVRKLEAGVDGGKARIRATITRVDEGTVRIVVKIRNPRDLDAIISPDEVLNFISFDASGNFPADDLGVTTINFDRLHLRPDGTPLRYEVTIRRPPVHRSLVRIIVDGEYVQEPEE